MSDKEQPKIDDLAQGAQELTDEQAENAKGGGSASGGIWRLQGDGSVRTTGDAEPPDLTAEPPDLSGRKAGGTQTNF